jgi:hypothetical protein
MVLFTDTSPRSAENFRQLCTGEAPAAAPHRTTCTAHITCTSLVFHTQTAYIAHHPPPAQANTALRRRATRAPGGPITSRWDAAVVGCLPEAEESLTHQPTNPSVSQSQT